MVEHVVELRGLPQEMRVAYAVVRQTWRWADDGHVAGNTVGLWGDADLATRTALGLPQRIPDPETERWLRGRFPDRVARGLPVWFNNGIWPSNTDRRVLLGRALLPDTLLSKIRARSPATDWRVSLDLARPIVMLELPFKPGAHGVVPSGACRIGEWLQHEETASVQFLTSVPSVKGNGLWMARAMNTGRLDNLPGEFLALNRRDATIGWVNRNESKARSGRLVVGGVILKWSTLVAYPERVMRDGKLVPSDPDWIEHTTLVLMRQGPSTRVTKDLKSDQYELEIAGPREEREILPSL
jgi:hypothetical protein